MFLEIESTVCIVFATFWVWVYRFSWYLQHFRPTIVDLHGICNVLDFGSILLHGICHVLEFGFIS